MIQWALEEIEEAGIPRAAIVISPSKPLLTTFLSNWKRGRSLRLDLIKQPRPAGLADALLRVRGIAGAKPFALLLPDNVFFRDRGSAGAMSQVLHAFANIDSDTCALVRVKPEHASRYSHAGLVDLERRARGPTRIAKLHGKRNGALKIPGGGPAYKTFARAVLKPHFFDYLKELATGRPDADEVPALQAVIKIHGLHGILMKGRGFDAGGPDGYAAAVEFWARRRTRMRQPTK
jgi:UTP-glucose-1-phosphate uridylyltransferase